MKKFTMQDINLLAMGLANTIAHHHPEGALRAFAIPRGGVPAALAVARHLPHMVIVDRPEDCDIFIDDIIDSGKTMMDWCDKYPARPFYALIDKTGTYTANEWVVFPWEGEAENSIEDNITRVLQFIGENPSRPGLLETPHRVAKAWLKDWAKGYAMNPADVLKVFEDGAENYDGAVTVKDIPIYSKCEHHLADIFGTATISYIPNNKIVGLSKLSRLAEVFSRRLQVQERLTTQIADALFEHLQPKGVGVVIKARHMCMESRGICQQGHHTVTVALRGEMKDDPSCREEFLMIANAK